MYVNAVEDAFGADVDYAMLTKVYDKAQENETRYCPAKILSSTTEVIRGTPTQSTSPLRTWSVRI